MWRGGHITLYPGNYEYFERRKKQRAEEAGELSAPVPVPQPSLPLKSARPSPKEERRRRALEREKERDKNKGLNPGGNRTEQAKARIEFLTQELQNPAIYNDYAQVVVIIREIETLQSEIQS